MIERVEEVSADGIHVDIPRELLEELGWRAGQQVRVCASDGQITIAPVRSIAEVISARALAYLDRRVGDATTVRPPARCGDRWRVPVVLRYANCELGSLVFTADGEFLRDESTEPAEMLRVAETVPVEG